MLYPAPSTRVGAPPPGYEEHLLEVEGGAGVHLWHRSAENESAPAVLFLHGNGENLETMHRSGLFADLDALGVHVVAIDYPGYGRSGGAAGEEAIRRATSAAFDWMVARHPDSPHAVAGWSLGAAVGVRLAADAGERLAGLVALSPWSSLEAVAGSHYPRWLVRLLLRESYDSVAAAGEVRCPSLVIHGEADWIIPVGQGREVAAALSDPTRWVEVPATGHNDLLSRRIVWEEMAAFLRTLAAYNRPSNELEVGGPR